MLPEEEFRDLLERGCRAPKGQIGGGILARRDRAQDFLRAIARFINRQRAVATDSNEAFGPGSPVSSRPIANRERFYSPWVNPRPETLELAVPNEIRFGPRLGLIDRPFRESDRGARAATLFNGNHIE